MIDAAALTAEIQNDPTTLGYAPFVAAGNDQAIADLLNTLRVGISVNRDTVTGNEFLAAVVLSDYTALVDADSKAWVKSLASMATIDVKNANIRAIVAGMFPGGSATRANLVALQTRQGSRAEQLFGAGNSVSIFDIARALGRG